MRRILFVLALCAMIGGASAQLNLLPKGMMLNTTLNWSLDFPAAGPTAMITKDCNDTAVWNPVTGTPADCVFIYAAYIITPYSDATPTIDSAVQKEYFLVTEKVKLQKPRFNITLRFTPPSDGTRYVVTQFLVRDNYKYDATINPTTGKTTGYVKNSTSLLSDSINATAVLGMCLEGDMVASRTGIGTKCYRASPVCPDIDATNKCNYPDVNFYCIDWDYYDPTGHDAVTWAATTPCDASMATNICADGMSSAVAGQAGITTPYPKDGICDMKRGILTCTDDISAIDLVRYPATSPAPGCPNGVSKTPDLKYCATGDFICDADDVLVAANIMCEDKIGYKGICDAIEGKLTIYNCDPNYFDPRRDTTTPGTCITYPNDCIANETCFKTSPPAFCSDHAKGDSLPKGTCTPPGYQCTITGADSYSSDCPTIPGACGGSVAITCIAGKCGYNGYCAGYCVTEADCNSVVPCVGVVNRCDQNPGTTYHRCYQAGTCVTKPGMNDIGFSLWDILKNMGVFTSVVWPKVVSLLGTMY